MDPAARPSVLFIYFTYTNQTRKVIDVMAEVLRGRGCDVQLAAIEFTDPRYAGRFQEFPMPHPFRELVGMIPAESPRRRPAKIAIPDVVTERDYDLVCIGSPTWWLSTDVPVRSFLQSDTASRVLTGKPFAAVVCCRRYWKHNLKTVRRLGTEARRRLRRRHSLPLPGRPGTLAAVAAELPRVRRVPRALPRDQDPADQPSGAPPGGGTEIRRRAGQPPGQQCPGEVGRQANASAAAAGADEGRTLFHAVGDWCFRPVPADSATRVPRRTRVLSCGDNWCRCPRPGDVRYLQLPGVSCVSSPGAPDAVAVPGPPARPAAVPIAVTT